MAVGVEVLVDVIWLLWPTLYKVYSGSILRDVHINRLPKCCSEFVSVLLQYRVPTRKSVTYTFAVNYQASGVFDRHFALSVLLFLDILGHFDNFQRKITFHRKSGPSQHMCIVNTLLTLRESLKATIIGLRTGSLGSVIPWRAFCRDPRRCTRST